MAGGSRVSGGARKRSRSTGGAAARKRYRITKALAPLRSLSYKHMFPMPKTTRTTLRYVSRGSFVNPSAGGLAATWIFSANGLYDPDISGIGHQPVGFDQLMGMYDHYTVLGAKIVIDVRNDDSTNPQLFGVAVRDSLAAETDPVVLIENGNVDYRLLNNGPNTPCQTRITMSTNIASYLGRKSILSDPECKGDSTSNPTEQVAFHCFGFTLGPGVDGGTMTFVATIDYDVVFHERKMLSKS